MDKGTLSGKSLYPEHGGNLKFACESSGFPPEEIIDFSVNVNPLGPPKEIETIWPGMARLLKVYPEPHYQNLKEVLAKRYKLDPSWITVTNGSSEFIYLLPRIWKSGKEVVLITPCFSEYIRAFKLARIKINKLPLQKNNWFQLSMETVMSFLKEPENIGGLVLSHPNNPTGNLFDRKFLIDLLEYCERKKIFLIIDESYIEFCKPENSLKREVGKFKYLIVIRSITKFYCLPGIRLGYGFLHPDWVRIIDKYKPPWSVNNLAQRLCSAAVSDFEYVKKSRDFIKKQKKYLSGKLSEIEDIKVFSSDSNFMLFEVRGQDEALSEKLYLFLLANKILIRNCGNFDGLTNSFFRVAVMKRNDNLLLISKMKEFFETINGRHALA